MARPNEFDDVQSILNEEIELNSRKFCPVCGNGRMKSFALVPPLNVDGVIFIKELVCDHCNVTMYTEQSKEP